MVREADTKINRVGPRHTIYLQKDLVEDSTFPFGLNEPLTIRVDGERLIIERTGRRTLAPDFGSDHNKKVLVTDVLERLGYTPILSRAEKIYEMLKEVHEAETLDLRVKHIPQGEHAVLLWHDRRLLEHVLKEYFDPNVTEGIPRGLLSETPSMNLPSGENMLYSRIVKDVGESYRGQVEENERESKREGSVAKNILEWLDRIRSAAKTPRMGGRAALENLSWFVQNGFQNEIEQVEQEIGLHPERGLSVLCSYDMTRVQGTQDLEKILIAHSYIIIDSPFRVYRKN